MMQMSNFDPFRNVVFECTEKNRKSEIAPKEAKFGLIKFCIFICRLKLGPKQGYLLTFY